MRPVKPARMPASTTPTVRAPRRGTSRNGYGYQSMRGPRAMVAAAHSSGITAARPARRGVICPRGSNSAHTAGASTGFTMCCSVSLNR